MHDVVPHLGSQPEDMSAGRRMLQVMSELSGDHGTARKGDRDPVADLDSTGVQRPYGERKNELRSASRTQIPP